MCTRPQPVHFCNFLHQNSILQSSFWLTESKVFFSFWRVFFCVWPPSWGIYGQSPPKLAKTSQQIGGPTFHQNNDMMYGVLIPLLQTRSLHFVMNI